MTTARASGLLRSCEGASFRRSAGVTMPDELWKVLYTAIGAAIGFAVKPVSEQLVKRREDIEKTARTKRLAFIEDQLSKFYWPIFIHLERTTPFGSGCSTRGRRTQTSRTSPWR